MKNRYSTILILAILLLCNSFADGQSRTWRIYRPCASSTTPAIVQVEKAGDLTLTPCPNRQTVIQGGTLTSITVSRANGRINIFSPSVVTRIGDINSVWNNTLLSVDDGSGQISLTSSSLAFTGNLQLNRTITAGGTTGNQTINKTNGSVNFAAAATTITVTNSLAGTTSTIIVTPQKLDGTCRTFVVNNRASGSFDITATAACTAETAVAFWVFN